MNSETHSVPVARSWRDIPQPVKLRAMSPGGRWRLARAGLRQAAQVLLVLALAGGIAMVAWSLRESAPRLLAPGESTPVRPPELKTTRDGVLDDAWLARRLALPPRVTLMQLDLADLRARLLADDQVLTASLTRQFPDRLIVHVTERTPVARVRVQQAGLPRDLLVARDGVVFAGTGFSPELLESLPWLGGVTLVPGTRGFLPLAGMDVVSRFLTDAQVASGHLYRTWKIVSLARLEADQEIEVITEDNTTAVFSMRGSFIVQLANLDYLTEKLARLPRARARIDLSLGREVPVAIEPLASDGARPATPAPGVTAFLPAFSISQPTLQREL